MMLKHMPYVIYFMLVQLNMLEEGLVNHPAVGFGESGRKANELRALLAKIEESEVCIYLSFVCVIYNLEIYSRIRSTSP